MEDLLKIKEKVDQRGRSAATYGKVTFLGGKVCFRRKAP